MKAMVLAAGRGERMRPLTDTTPKPLLRVNGRALIDYHLDALVRAGVTEVVVNVAWLQAQLRAHLSAWSASRGAAAVTLHISDEGASALETGGGIFQALPWLQPQPFWVVNGDIHVEFEFVPPPLAAGTLAYLLLTPNPAHNPAGDFALADGRVTNTGPEMLTYTGIAVLRPELFADCTAGAFPLAPLLRAAADAGRVEGALLPGAWCDVGTPARLNELDARLRG